MLTTHATTSYAVTMTNTYLPALLVYNLHAMHKEWDELWTRLAMFPS